MGLYFCKFFKLGNHHEITMDSSVPVGVNFGKGLLLGGLGGSFHGTKFRRLFYQKELDGLKVSHKFSQPLPLDPNNPCKNEGFLIPQNVGDNH